MCDGFLCHFLIHKYKDKYKYKYNYEWPEYRPILFFSNLW